MKDAHQGRGIGSKEFGLVVGHVVATKKELKVSEALITTTVNALAPLKADCTDEEEVKVEDH
jgi:hypothetical protein